MRFQRSGGRKRIVAPDGSEIVPTSRPQPHGILIKALALAWPAAELLDNCVYSSVTEIWEAEKINKSYISNVQRHGHADGPRRRREMTGLVEDDPVRPAGLGAQLRKPGQEPWA